MGGIQVPFGARHMGGRPGRLEEGSVMVSSGSAPFAQLSGHLVLVGAGKMGTALLEGWLDHGLPPGQTVVIEPSPSPEIEALARRGLLLNPAAAVEAAALVLAVKPQVAPNVLPRLSPWVGAATLVVSIMAGRTLSFVQRMLPATGAAVRAMPNTPAAIKRGVTVLVDNDRVSARQRDLSELLFAGVGTVDWVDDEAMMDAVTAVSGSGPAYVFLLAEALARAGVAAGLPEDLAGRIARATVSGVRRTPRPVAARRRHLAPERHLAGRHDGGGARRADGHLRPRTPDGTGGSPGDPPLPRTRRLKAGAEPTEPAASQPRSATSGTGVRKVLSSVFERRDRRRDHGPDAAPLLPRSRRRSAGPGRRSVIGSSPPS